MSKAAYASAVQSSHAKPGKKELAYIRVHEAENGGHVVEHNFASSARGYQEPEQHVFGKGEGKAVMAHIAKHMNIEGHAMKEQDGEEHAESVKEEPSK